MITTDALEGTLRDGVSSLLTAVTAHDGVAPVDEAGRLALDGDGARHLVLPGPEGAPGAPTVIGYAGLLADGTVQGAVHPDHRRAGHGRALLDAALKLRADAGIWSHGALPPALALLRGRGLVETRRLLVLRRPLDGEPLPPVPASRVPVRLAPAAGEQDAADWLALNAEAFADHPEQGGLTRSDLDRRFAEDWFDARDLHLARTEDGRLAGSVWAKRTERGQTGEDAEIYVVATSPAAQGQGVGSHLLGAVLHALAAEGAASAHLYVEGDNTAALALYERWGFTVAESHVRFGAPATAGR